MTLTNEAATAIPDTETHFHYHAFPRRWRNDGDANAKGLGILDSIIKSGFLLVPERIKWPGEIKGGSIQEGVIGYHTRACFTYLSEGELKTHSTEFGAFAIELTNADLRTLGGIPVFYIPVGVDNAGYSGIGAAVVSRLADIQDLLTRLKLFLDVGMSWSDPTLPVVMASDGNGGAILGVPREGQNHVTFPPGLFEKIRRDKPDFQVDRDLRKGMARPLGCTSGAFVSLLHILTWGIQSFDVQLGSIRGISGYFVPTERPDKGDLLSYYHQREWRILSGSERDGVSSSRILTAVESARLLALDDPFFSKMIPMPDGKSTRLVDECRMLSEIEGEHVLRRARRIVCPASAVQAATEMLAAGGFSTLPVVALETLSR